MDIHKVAVIGAGVMGAGIAAHIANAGIPVMLLDIVPEGAADRSQIATTALDKLLKADPAPLMHQKNARLVTPGNIEDDLPQLAECDWIIEAIVERLAIKQDLYRKLATVRQADAIVSSNTSSIPAARTGGRLAGRLRRTFHDHPLFQPAALHAPAGNRQQPANRSGCCCQNQPLLLTRNSAKAWYLARTHRDSSPTASAFSGYKPPSTKPSHLA